MIESPAALLRVPAGWLLIATVVLMSLGIVMVYSASGARAGLEERRAMSAAKISVEQIQAEKYHDSSYARKQLAWGLVGIGLMVGLMRVPIDYIEKAAPWVLGLFGIVLILLLVTPLGVEAKGARRWMRLGPFTWQPSEFAKIALVIFMARFLSDKRVMLRDFRQGFVPAMIILGAFLLLIVLEKDLGMTVLCAAAALGMWVIARMRALHIGAVMTVCLFAGFFLILTHSYRVNRILAFMDPEQHAMTHAYQLNQSLIAVGSGGLWGNGLGNGIQKYHFLSESHTDFIFSIVCEELGFIGAASIVILFSIFLYSGFQIAQRAPDFFGSLMAAGLTILLGCSIFINFVVTLGLGPTKGLALPFFSYGGSSLMSTLIIVGLLLNVANYSAALRRSPEMEAAA